MPSLESFASDPAIRLLLIGHSKSRKTSSLSSLVKAGFKLLIADFDQNLDYLAHDLKAHDPSLLANVIVEAFHDKSRLSRKGETKGDIVADGSVTAYENFMRMLDEGVANDGEPILYKGSPIGPVSSLDRSWIVVLDSLWAAGRMAFLEHRKLSPAKDIRKTFYGAGQMLLTLLDGFKDPSFSPHVIIISHMTLVEQDEGAKFFPSSLGSKNAMDVPKLFPRLLVCERRGSGNNAKYVISTVSTNDIDAGSALPADAVPDKLPQETGLATYFAACGAKP